MWPELLPNSRCFWQIWKPRSRGNTRIFSGPDMSLPAGEPVPGIYLATLEAGGARCTSRVVRLE